MLLTELIGIKKYHDFEYHEILKKLSQEAGVEWIGSGKYGIVLSNPSWDYVIKVFENDPYYMDFVNYVTTHKSRHYPKIVKKPIKMRSFYKRRKKNLNETFFICKIEKLYPLPKPLGQFVAYNLDRLWSSYLWIYSTTNEQRKEYEKRWGKDNGRDYSANTPFSTTLPDGTTTKISHRELFNKFPWLRTLTRAYINVMENMQGVPDLHEGNFMQRKDGTIIIIDPVWAGETPYQAFDRANKAEYDDYYDEEPEMVSGPAYLKKNKQQPEIKQPDPEQSLKYSDYDDPDVPF